VRLLQVSACAVAFDKDAEFEDNPANLDLH
jgi:hypothetical protein